MQNKELLLRISEFQLALSYSNDNTSILQSEKLMEIESEDPFVNYGIAKALKMFIVNCTQETDFTTLILLLLKKLQTTETAWMKLRIFTCLNCVLTSKVLKKLDHKDVLIHIISKEWNKISDDMLKYDLLSGKKEELSQNDTCLFEFIRLWKKIVKHNFKSQKSTIYEILQDIYQDTSVLWDIMLKLNKAMFSKAILKLFNCMLPYGEFLSQFMPKVHTVFEQIAVPLFEFFQNGGLYRILVGQNCGFTGKTKATTTTVDKLQLRLVIMLTMKTTAIIATGENTVDDCLKCILDLDVFLKSHFKHSGECVSSWVPEMFEDQDDMWIEMLLVLLDMYNLLALSRDLNSFSPDIQSLINPHQQFSYFLKATNFDDSYLVDLLTSPETCFLLYLMRYLKCLRKEWDIFVIMTKELSSANDEKVNEKVEISMYSTLTDYPTIACDNKEMDIEGEGESPELLASSSGLTLLGLYESDNSDVSSEQNFEYEDEDDEDADTHKRNEMDNEDEDYDDHFNRNNQIIDEFQNNDGTAYKTDTHSPHMSDTNISRVIFPWRNHKINSISSLTETSPVKSLEDRSSSKSETVTNSKDNTNYILDGDCEQKYDYHEEKPVKKSNCEMENHDNLCYDLVPCLNSPGYQTMSNQYKSGNSKNELCNGEKLLDSIMSCIIRVRLKITRLWKNDLFPYNPEPLILNISKIEELYESVLI